MFKTSHTTPQLSFKVPQSRCSRCRNDDGYNDDDVNVIMTMVMKMTIMLINDDGDDNDDNDDDDYDDDADDEGYGVGDGLGICDGSGVVVGSGGVCDGCGVVVGSGGGAVSGVGGGGCNR